MYVFSKNIDRAITIVLSALLVAILCFIFYSGGREGAKAEICDRLGGVSLEGADGPICLDPKSVLDGFNP